MRVLRVISVAMIALLLVVPLVIIGLAAKLLRIMGGMVRGKAVKCAPPGIQRAGNAVWPVPARWQRATFEQLKGTKHVRYI